MSVIDMSEHSAFAIARRARERAAAEAPPVVHEPLAWNDAQWVRSPARIIHRERYINQGDPATLWALATSPTATPDGEPDGPPCVDRDNPDTWQHLQPCSSLPDRVTGTFGEWRRDMHVEDPDAEEPFSI